MVTAVKAHPALAAWEIINEPEGLVYSNNYNSINCFNTQPLANSGAGWNNNWIPMQQYLNYIHHFLTENLQLFKSYLFIEFNCSSIGKQQLSRRPILALW